MSSLPVTRETLERYLDGSAFQRSLGLSLESFDAEAQTLVMRAVYGAQVERTTGSGQFHGGVIASLIDIAGDFALIAVLGYGVPTINLRIDYLRPALGHDLLAPARVRRAGRSIGVVDIEVKDASDRLIALGRGCYGTQQG
jgi:uncharacterized protein (TIGR00369 family)